MCAFILRHFVFKHFCDLDIVVFGSCNSRCRNFLVSITSKINANDEDVNIIFEISLLNALCLFALIQHTGLLYRNDFNLRPNGD